MQFWITNKIDSNTAEILIYGYIDAYDVSAGDFVKELRGLEKEYTNIQVRINSGGGNVFDGFAIYNAMKQSNAVIDTYVDGVAASMASIIAQGGRKRYISKVGQQMTHKPSAVGWGNSEDLRKNADLLDSLEKMMCSIYASTTGKSTDDCKIKFLNGKDNWFDAQQTITEGLADEIYDAEPIALPAAKSEKDIWNQFHTQRFAAKFIPSQNSNENMKQVFIPAASLAALGLSDAAEQSTIEEKIVDLVAKAAKVDAAEIAKKKAEDDLAALQVLTTDEKVTRILDDALAVKKITIELKNELAIQYKGKPDELKKIVDAMKPFESITKTIVSDVDKTELAALMAKSGDELFKEEGALERLKALSPEAYKLKYKQWAGIDAPAE